MTVCHILLLQLHHMSHASIASPVGHSVSHHITTITPHVTCFYCITCIHRIITITPLSHFCIASSVLHFIITITPLSLLCCITCNTRYHCNYITVYTVLNDVAYFEQCVLHMGLFLAVCITYGAILRARITYGAILRARITYGAIFSCVY